MHTNNDKRLLYRVLVKIMFLIGLLALAFALLSSMLSPPNSKALLVETQSIAEPLLVNAAQIPYGQIRNYRWNNRDIGILHLTDDMQTQLFDNHRIQQRHFVFYNNGGDLNCPISIVKKQAFQLEDICSHIPYNLAGQLIHQQDKRRAKALIAAPFYYRSEQQIMIGREQAQGDS